MAWGRKRKLVDRQPDGRPSQVESYNANKKGAKMRMARKVAVTGDDRLSAEFPLSILLGRGVLTTPASESRGDYDAREERLNATARHDAGMRFSSLYRRLFGRSTAQSMDLGYSAPLGPSEVEEAIASKDTDREVLSEEAQRVKSLAAYEAMRDALLAKGREIGVPDLLPMMMRYAAMLQRDCFIDDVISGRVMSAKAEPWHVARAAHIRFALDTIMRARSPVVRDDVDAEVVVMDRRRRAESRGALIPTVPYSHMKEAA